LLFSSLFGGIAAARDDSSVVLAGTFAHQRGIQMVLEMAALEIKPGMESAFERGVVEALPYFKRARGCHGAQLHRSVEHPSSYILMVTWETVDDHMVHFRPSEDFKQWRRLVGEYFAETPRVSHTQIVVPGF
jgi:quinol monooxygenase YgiN